MLFNSSSKTLPYLTNYLQSLATRQANRGKRMGIVGGIVGAIGGMTGAALGILGGVGLIRFSSFGLATTIIGINLASWAVVLYFWLMERRAFRKDDDHNLRQAAMAIAKAMLKSRRLHKELNTGAAQLLEQSAEDWHQVMSALASQFWTSPNLPAHWQGVRGQAETAANRAMEEELVLLRESFAPDRSRSGWEDAVEHLLETYVTGPRPGRNEHLPVGFEQAREIAGKLRLLAREVEQATREVSRTEEVRREFEAGSALDLALGDLRTVRQAEEELRQITTT